MSGSRGHFGRQQSQNEAVLVGGPYRAVLAQERGAGTFLAGESERAADQAIDAPFESHGALAQFSPGLVRAPVDDRAGDDGLAHRGVVAPLRTMFEQIGDRRGEI